MRILGNPKGCLLGWRIACDADLGGREVGAAFREFLAISLVCGFVRYWCVSERERESCFAHSARVETFLLAIRFEVV